MKLSELSDFDETALSDLYVAELARDMISFIAEQFATASKKEKAELTLRYGPVLLELQRAIRRASRGRRRQAHDGGYERK